MSQFEAPLQDMLFVLREVWRVEANWAHWPDTVDFNLELASAVLEEANKLSRDELYPLFRSGDEDGCKFNDGQVTTPAGFKAAYDTLTTGGWCGLGGDPEFNGQGLPKTLVVLFEEMLFAANNSLALYPILSSGGAMCLSKHGSTALKNLYLPKLYSGQWSSAMGLTESHCGTDLGLINTKAQPQTDETYKITGSKIFITGGDHDLCENIIHLVLAKLPDAPAGVKGISLFLVPKYQVLPDGQLGAANQLSPGSIEHKMGIKGSATCVMNFDGAVGWLVGEANQGLAAMFTMMNYERLSIGLQGLGSAEMAYQLAVDYAKDRLQGRAPGQAMQPDKPADAIIHHPDVRRMLLEVRTFVEGGRAFAGYVACQLDTQHFSKDQQSVERAEYLVALLIPVAKAFLTDKGFDACVTAQQVFGGHGYVREWGAEQLVRDARIAQIYEGTNGIQALDLMGRKIVRSNGGLLVPFYEDIQTILDLAAVKALPEFGQALAQLLSQHRESTEFVLAQASEDPAIVGAASVDYLHLTGYLALAFVWAKMAGIASAQPDSEFHKAKLLCAKFFYAKLLPRAQSHHQQILAGAQATMAMPAEYF